MSDIVEGLVGEYMLVGGALPWPQPLPYQGGGLIAGISPGLVTVDGIAAARTVRLYDRGPADDMANLGTGVLARQTVSAADGTYAFPNISMARKYTVMAVDDEGVHNAVVADLVVPVAMPE